MTLVQNETATSEEKDEAKVQDFSEDTCSSPSSAVVGEGIEYVALTLSKKRIVALENEVAELNGEIKLLEAYKTRE
eukprot:CAMPEP_0195533248 /NCGR_PEP_ID=MMETSP0794_2-20130614/40122_1 /TAXON_ID=515487 /ORGANISM="Stephanopyxis turris, Strain CCMP 815" /LENGTH=75 /DNA_ID=CAMNT_0040665705 /DNA_START=1 /DNA_END=225 /DNA_ORIENTATION=-